MAGYNDTRRMIVKTLMGRPTGTEIQPEDHQAFALQITDYVRSVELLAGNATPIGFAEADTVPVRPNNGQALYLSQVNRGETVTFKNFIDQDGNAITVSSDENTITLVNLLWNTLYWTKQETHISLEKSVHGDDIVDGAVTTPKIADGAVTDIKLSAEVQAILNDVANKQNITDESLATIAKTIVGAINEVYKGGLEDASIATSKIEDGAVTTDKLADTAVTEDKLASQSVSSKKIKDATIGASKLRAKSVTEPKLNDVLTAKVNNNVKTVEQILTDNELRQVSMNLKFRDNYQNFFANKYSYEAVVALKVKPNYYVFGNSCTDNTFGVNCFYATLGNNCRSNTFGDYCEHNILGNGCSYNKFGTYLQCSKIDSGVTYIELRSNAGIGRPLKNIHILSGVKGSSSAILTINIPDEYLNSSRELIITTKVTNGGPLTPEDLVMYYADEVVNKQNKQDTTLETSSKEVVGAINELFNGGVKDGSIAASKLAQAVQDTLGMVGTNVKELPAGTDLLSADLEDGIWIVFCSKMTNAPSIFARYEIALLIVNSNRVVMMGTEASEEGYPVVARRGLKGNEWGTHTMISVAFNSFRSAVQETLDTKLDNTAGAVGAKNIADGAVTNAKIADKSVDADKIADNSITMSMLKKARSSYPDIGMAVFHALRINLKNNNQTGSAILSSVGVNYTNMIDIHIALEHIVKTLGAGVTIQVYELDDEGLGTTYLGTVVGFNKIDDEITAIVRNQIDPSKDYFVVINTVNYEFTTKICLTDQLPKIASLETDVTTLQGLINTKVKIINENTDLNTITEEGMYLLRSNHSYTNYPNSDGAISDIMYPNAASLLIVSYGHTETTLTQLLVSVSNSFFFPMIRCRSNYGNGWANWNNDMMYPLYDEAHNSVKNENTLSDTEINNIWDNN